MRSRKTLLIATGESYWSLCFTFQVLHITISCILREVSAMILAKYQDEVFEFQTTPDMWQDIASGFIS